MATFDNSEVIVNVPLTQVDDSQQTHSELEGLSESASAEAIAISCHVKENEINIPESARFLLESCSISWMTSVQVEVNISYQSISFSRLNCKWARLQFINSI